MGAVLLTPRDANGKVDLVRTKEYVAYLVQAGLPHFFTTGTYGEGPLMEGEELSAFLEAVVASVNGKARVIANVGVASQKASVERARRAVDCGVDAVASTPPYYYAHDTSSLHRYFEAVAETCDALVVYNNPYRSGTDLSPGTIVELARSLPVIAVKEAVESGRRFVQLLDELPKSTQLLIGTDDALLAGLAMGAAGGIAVLAAVLPELFVELQQAVSDGNLSRAGDLQAEITRIRTVLATGPYISSYKELSRLLGRDVGPAALPIRPPTRQEMEAIVTALQSTRTLAHVQYQDSEGVGPV